LYHWAHSGREGLRVFGNLQLTNFGKPF
jgi:hypothetical protein